MEMKDPKDWTPEQHKQMKSLFFSTVKRNVVIGAKYGTLLFLSNLAVVLLDAYYVQSQTFSFVASVVNCIFLFRAMTRETRKEHDRIKAEAKKILETDPQ